MFRNEVYAEPLDKDNPWITFKRIDMVKLHFKDTIKINNNVFIKVERHH